MSHFFVQINNIFRKKDVISFCDFARETEIYADRIIQNDWISPSLIADIIK